MSRLHGVLGAWRVPLRLARRDARRARARSILVLVMIALPVLAVTAADVVMHTQDVRGAESLDRRLGAASARVTAQDGAGRVFQAADPEQSSGSDGSKGSLITRAEASRLLGGAPLVDLREGSLRVRSGKGVAFATGTETDLHDHVTTGLFDLRSGRLPRTPGEVVVNHALAEKGYAVGDRLQLVPDPSGSARGSSTPPSPTIVGIAESTSVRDYPVATGPVGSLGVRASGSRSWLVGGGAVTWAEVRRLNERGAAVLSRSVMLDPPPASEIPAQVRSFGGGGPDPATVAVLVLVVVMALIEVVLLAGPAFAVGARRQARSLALMAAVGGTPRQARRVVLASAVVLGSAAAALGVVLGIALGWASLPILQRFSSMWFGPFEVPWLQLLGIACFGLLSAWLAAVVPAWIASRQDVVAVLAGRRGDRRPSARSPLLGLVLMAVGVAGAARGASRASGGEFLIAGSAIFSVLGMILLVPVVLAVLSRLSRRMPLTVRYAVRDASRHRTRTVPAVAAVAATVAGVVALGIGNASDAAQNEQTYQPFTSMGSGVITSYAAEPEWAAYRTLAERELPGTTVTPVLGSRTMLEDGSGQQVEITDTTSKEPLVREYGSSLGSDVLVSDDALPAAVRGLSRRDADRADDALRADGLVVLTSDRSAPPTTEVNVTLTSFSEDGDETTGRQSRLIATVVHTGGYVGAPQAVASTAAARRMGLPVGQVALFISGGRVTQAQEQAVTEGITAISGDGGLTMERGYQAEDETIIIQLILAALGGILMLGGTLTATFLALSDARSDLATLSAVGASPRTRRRVAAAYAAVIGVVGALLGALVGAIPGVAVSFPLTRGFSQGGETPVGPFLDVPWLLVLGLVALLPLLTAAVVGLAARSRLPLMSRLQ